MEKKTGWILVLRSSACPQVDGELKNYNNLPPLHKNSNEGSVVEACNAINARDDKLLNLLRNRAAEKYTIIIYTK